MKPVRVLFIGWDGAEPELVEPWVRQGRLPVLGDLIARGAGGRVASTIPPLTPPAWTSLLSGLDPGRHGIYSFTHPTATDYAEHLVNRLERQAPSIWSYMTAAGQRTGIFNFSLSFPPEPVDGFHFAGFDTPVLDANIVYPQEAFPVAMAGLSGYVHYAPEQLHDAAAAQELARQMRQQRDLVFNLTRAYPVEVLAVNFNSPDHIHHRGWPVGQPAAALAATTDSWVELVYRNLDTVLGELLERYTDERTHIVLVSDHGGGVMRGQVSLAAALEEGGFLVRLSQKRSQGRGALRDFAHRVLPRRVKSRLWSLLGLRVRAEMADRMRARRMGKVDWSRTVAFPWGTAGYVQVNIKGRQPEGAVAPEDRERVLTDVEACLRELRDPVTGVPVLAALRRGEDAYKEPRVGYPPDLVVDDTEYGVKPYWENREAVRHIFAEDTSYDGFTSNHRPDGILVTCGPAVRAGTTLPPLGMADLAPALLYLAGVPIPGGLDGRLARSVWDTGAEPEGQAAQELTADVGEAPAYTDQEQAAVEERLRDLGYM
jgi:predicted AlkP superfamily phosphohydrolase/phosphomutase